MLINKKITVLFIVFLTVIFLLPQAVFAQVDVFGTNALQNTNLGTRTIYDTIAGIVNVLLGFLGIVAVGIIIYGGFMWMTSQGNADKIDKAKKILVNGLIGLAIVVSAFAISRFVLERFYNETVLGGGGGGGGSHSSGSGLGATVLDSHYPPRYAVGVARNTNIYVTFREDMGTSFVVNSGCSYGATLCLDNTHVRIVRNDTGVAIPGAEVAVTINDPAHPTTFGFNPYNDSAGVLGDNGSDTLYSVELNDLRTATNKPAFPLGSYVWDFTVGTFIDNTPPTVTVVIPDGSTNPYARNSIVQINFSEAVNPMYTAGIVAGGVVPADLYLSVSEGGTAINGEFSVSNQYRTSEFVTNDLCGSNSCGGDVYCLPDLATIDGLVLQTVEDMAGNRLDMDDDGTFGEDPDDRFTWSFETNNEIDLSAPYITYMDSGIDRDLEDPIVVVFNKTLNTGSVNGSTMGLYKNNWGDINFWFEMDTTTLLNDTIHIMHDEFLPLTDYTATSTSNIKDSLQNCWYPCDCQGPSCDCNPASYCGPGGCTTY